MLILSSTITPTLLSPATLAGIAESTVQTPARSESNRSDTLTEESSEPQTNSEDQRPTGRAARSLAPLDLQTQNAAQNAPTQSQNGEVQADENASEDADAPTPAEAESALNERKNEEGEKVDANGLTEQERREVDKLRQRDREVKEHEQAHASVGGGIAGQPSFKFTTGPDGKQYAVAGEVQIDTSPVRGNPAATIRKLEQVKRAALAPSTPSAQDRRVASRAEASISTARRELAELNREELEQNGDSSAQISASSSRRESDIGAIEDAGFDSNDRFQNVFKGIGELPGTGLAGAGALETNVGLSDPGDLFDLVT